MDLTALSKALDEAINLPPVSSRIFHGRGHCYPGLEFINVDWFAPVIWAVLYGEVAEEDTSAIKQLLAEFASKVDTVKSVYVQQRHRGKASQDCVYGELPDELFAKESDMRFHLNMAANQNIGFFLDAKPGREWVRDNAQGKRVLNLFAYTCSFSVAALRGGADKVVNIDMAKSALATGQKNHVLNDLDVSKASFLPHDIFRSTRKLEGLGPYDLVIMDPPSRQKGSFEADKDYKRLLKKLAPMLADNAQILACLNAPYLGEDFLLDCFAEALPEFSLKERLAQREDFPEKDLARCLKMQIFERK